MLKFHMPAETLLPGRPGLLRIVSLYSAWSFSWIKSHLLTASAPILLNGWLSCCKLQVLKAQKEQANQAGTQTAPATIHMTGEPPKISKIGTPTGPTGPIRPNSTACIRLFWAQRVLQTEPLSAAVALTTDLLSCSACSACYVVQVGALHSQRRQQWVHSALARASWRFQTLKKCRS